MVLKLDHVKELRYEEVYQNNRNLDDRVEFMEKRMDQMQLMMEQMLEHQQELQDSAK